MGKYGMMGSAYLITKMKQCIMTQVRNPLALPSSQPEVYNKDLEALVEVLQDKLEGVELREEHLKERVKQLQEKFYKVGMTCDTTSYAIGYFSTYEEAHKYLKDEVASFITSCKVANTDSIYVSEKLHMDVDNNVVIRSWTIDSIKFGEAICHMGSVKNLLTLARMGELIRVDGEGK